MKFIQDEIHNINAELAKLDEGSNRFKSLETAKNTLRWVLDSEWVLSPTDRYKNNHERIVKSDLPTHLPTLEAVITAYLNSQRQA